MRKKTRRLFLGMLIGSSLLSTISCSNDDSSPITVAPDKPENPTTPTTPAEKATVKLTVNEFDDTSVSFTVQATNAKEVYYYIFKNPVKGELPKIDGEEIVKQGTKIEDLDKEIIVTELENLTEYAIVAAAKNTENIISVLEKPEVFSTLQKIDVSIILSKVSASHEQIFFTIQPIDAIQVNYKIVKKGTKVTVDEVLETGSKLFNVKVTSNLKPKGFDADTEYTIYAAGLSATGAKILRHAEVRTTAVPEKPSEDGIMNFTTLSFQSEKDPVTQGKISFYTLLLSNTEWEAKFEIANVSSILNAIPEGKYTLPAYKESGKPTVERIGSDFYIKNKKTGETIKDIDYGDLIITKKDSEYTIDINMVKKDYTQKYKATYKGIPVYKK
ncbi:hypothetical protein VSP20_01490 [Myroides phaeus]|uniref:hypothetical protein n=1 Tax=Myroides phaeus TaxID=702745 RepID=UPI002DBCE2E1|nr:hypothetical protein [Myroides phaeus]MEC4115630.1 hypothetical protein [Myroides phaeus]